MMPDLFELGQSILGSRTEDAPSKSPSATSTVFGEALSNSSNGLIDVLVYDSGNPLYGIGTNIYVEQGWEVEVTLVGGVPRVTGTNGGGDREHEAIEEAADRYYISTACQNLTRYPDGTWIPSEASYGVYLQAGSKGVAIPHIATIRISTSEDGEEWTEFDEVESSSVAIDPEMLPDGWRIVSVEAWSIAPDPDPDGGEPAPAEPVLLASAVSHRVDESTNNYQTKNSAGLWTHEFEGDENYDKGAYSRLYTDGMEVGKDKVPGSRFGLKLIQLGLNAVDAVIEFCGGLGVMQQTVDAWSRSKLAITSKYGVTLGTDTGNNNLSARVGAEVVRDANNADVARASLYAQGKDSYAQLDVYGDGRFRFDSPNIPNGALPTDSGGTGNTNGTVGKLTTARTVRTNLASTAVASFDGSANITPGVTGTLPYANGGTNATSQAAARSNLMLNYTTGEQGTGETWIDGKAIYRKTVNTGAISSANKTVSHGISNMATVVSVKGMALSGSSLASGGVWVPIAPRVNPNNTATGSIEVQVGNTTLNFVVGSAANFAGGSYVTIEYTKTT